MVESLKKGNFDHAESSQTITKKEEISYKNLRDSNNFFFTISKRIILTIQSQVKVIKTQLIIKWILARALN